MSDRASTAILRITGLGLVGVGTVGIVVPLWPTTCFYLGAIWCFARSAPGWIDRIYRIPGVGSALRSYIETGIVPRPILIRTGAFLWAGLLVSWLALSPGRVVTGILAVVGLAVSLHLHSLDRANRRSCPRHR